MSAGAGAGGRDHLGWA